MKSIRRIGMRSHRPETTEGQERQPGLAARLAVLGVLATILVGLQAGIERSAAPRTDCVAFCENACHAGVSRPCTRQCQQESRDFAQSSQQAFVSEIHACIDGNPPGPARNACMAAAHANREQRDADGEAALAACNADCETATQQCQEFCQSSVCGSGAQ